MVAGGKIPWKLGFGIYTSSTEILFQGGHGWVTVQPLPRLLLNMASVSLGDSVLLIGRNTSNNILQYQSSIAGGYSKDSISNRQEILSINSSLVWSVVGSIRGARIGAAAAVLKFKVNNLNISSCL